MDEKDKQGFVVKDRRKVSLDDLDRPEEPTGTAPPPPEPPPEAPPEPEAKPKEQRGERDQRKSIPLPQVTFSTFVFSLSSSALVHLGEVPEPSSNQTRSDLPMAKQIIDTLGMLDEKTKGNLDRDEDQLLQTVLYDLRMRYIQKSPR
ncbi:MAG: DUF1844 domain-containing protein [Syntrophobacteraceae bacterium CG07_land_8_20_14_0_80_61_8]|nr:MAG: DUF1844 domain-containing protein [Syntrophobacteraceae bacterium CG07_land_8_20_14_0_80_61_8]